MTINNNRVGQELPEDAVYAWKQLRLVDRTLTLSGKTTPGCCLLIFFMSNMAMFLPGTTSPSLPAIPCRLQSYIINRSSRSILPPIYEMASGAPTLPHSSLWPTKEQYLWLLRVEACHRGLLFTSKELELLPRPFTCEEISQCQRDAYSTTDEWLEFDNWDKEDAVADHGHNQDQKPGYYANITDSAERRMILANYGWLYLKSIQRNLNRRLNEAGATKSQVPCDVDAVIHDLGTLWASTVERIAMEDTSWVRIGIFSDIPQEETAIKFMNIPLDQSFTDFKTQATAKGIVRYLTTTHHPALAKTLFLADSLVYHHPYPTAIDRSDPSFPPEIYPTKRDYDKEDTGWYAHITSQDPLTLSTEGMIHQSRDWKPINSEADWQSLLRLLVNSSASNPPSQQAFLRHKSVEDRMEFIQRHREREELELLKTGGTYTNVFLQRHLDEMYPPRSHEGMSPPFSPPSIGIVEALEGTERERNMKLV
jgi:hypothetical protein